MANQSISLTPTEAGVLARCSLHYHFLRQTPAAEIDEAQALLDRLVRETLLHLHASGGPGRLPLDVCLRGVQHHPQAADMVTRYYHRLARHWPMVMASNETLQLKTTIAGVGLVLEGTIDRLDRTRDGGLLAILFRTEAGPPPEAEALRRQHAMSICHALVAASYIDKRPIRLQELWLQADEAVTIELSEEEYRNNLRALRQPVLALSRGEVMARPGWHCDLCPFKQRGCPVYAHESTGDDLATPPPRGKIPPRRWIFKV